MPRARVSFVYAQKRACPAKTAGHALFCQNETGNYCPGVGNLPQSVPQILFYIKISTIYCVALHNTTTIYGGFGAPSGTRTRDPLIKSQLLYQLS